MTIVKSNHGIPVNYLAWCSNSLKIGRGTLPIGDPGGLGVIQIFVWKSCSNLSKASLITELSGSIEEDSKTPQIRKKYLSCRTGTFRE